MFSVNATTKVVLKRLSSPRLQRVWPPEQTMALRSLLWPRATRLGTHHLGHRAAVLRGPAARFDDVFHLGILELFALGDAVLAAFGTGLTHMAHYRAHPGTERGRQSAAIRRIDAEVCGRVLTIPSTTWLSSGANAAP
jgi:hypothetical protein